MKCVAIDDEPIALSIIKEYCRRYGGIDLQAFTSPVAGLMAVMHDRPDVVFLDIEMNSHNGVDLARQMPAGTCVIFTTAYAQYALDGYNVDAIDFLHKPIFYHRFERAMEKARRYLNSVPAVDDNLDDALTVRVGYQNVMLRTSEILYVEAMDNYVKVFRRNNLPTVVTQLTMKEMEGRLSDERFVRVHRSFIVSVADIERFSHRQVFLRNMSRPIPVGRKYIEIYRKLNDCITINKTDNNTEQ